MFSPEWLGIFLPPANQGVNNQFASPPVNNFAMSPLHACCPFPRIQPTISKVAFPLSLRTGGAFGFIFDDHTIHDTCGSFGRINFSPPGA